MAVIVDAEDYFATARQAFLQARQRIMLVGWDFDSRVDLHVAKRLPGEPAQIGELLSWLIERNPDLHLYLLRWDVGALKGMFRGSTALRVLKWMRHPRIHLKLDGHHPTGSSHHQKIVSIDDCFAFCGGIDMTGSRWDSRAHHDNDPGRTGPDGKPYPPWHDATTALSGPAAGALAQGCRDRWERATGKRLAPVEGEVNCWPDGLAPTFSDVDVAIARTHPKMEDQEPIYEIEELFLRQIASAKRFLYCESQYFACRRIAEAIGKRLEEEDGPEIVILNPQTAEGWLQPIAMDSARARLVAALKARDRHGRLAIYHPFTSAGEPIYVHAKITIVDDCELRIGSANLNNRSMRLDTECDVSVDSARQSGSGLEDSIAGVRNGLLAEHLDVPPERVAAVLKQTGSLIATIERLRRAGHSLRPYQIPDLAAVTKWLADNEVLDPESPDEMFEPMTGGGLLRRLRRSKHR
ncbi:phospholipase [Sphingomonas sp. CGMCC 1.13654]|uniref:Phospholipase D n=1 Tax=Sphingomonas chungangi TaxID=2683589 RepID=A0A838LD44_9SPHN|nr:phospholipase D-like domain-containing protein [Sphingomonas chungangi]MBA2936665.1 phospholipase [Sphingomonas chungangi]MVW56050.1 phospholipase [Sphingomonas chungangi]